MGLLGWPPVPGSRTALAQGDQVMAGRRRCLLARAFDREPGVGDHLQVGGAGYRVLNASDPIVAAVVPIPLRSGNRLETVA